MFDFINISSLLLWLSFAVCLSITTGGLLIIFRFGQIKRLPELAFLQYFLVLIYIFAYYSLWSNILLPQFTEFEEIEKISSVISQLGIPFFLLALVMQVIWVSKIQGIMLKVSLPFTFVLSLIMIFAFKQWLWLMSDLGKALYSIIGFTVEITLLALFVYRKQAVLKPQWAIYFYLLLVCSGLLHLSYFIPLAAYHSYETLFVLLFVLVNTTMVVVYIYTAEVEKVVLSFDDFILKHGISKRETDIIQGIYAGRTNQEIADSLFITLQTVKDHSSRIYQKAQVKNRGQLTSLLRESQSILETSS